MTANVRAFYLLPPQLAEFGGGIGSALWPEQAPAVLWGQGTPDGDRAPFTVVNKGSLYLCTNNADDVGAVYQKVDEGDADTDWVLLGGQSGGIVIVTSALFDISAAASEQVLYHAVTADEILEAGIIWNEATGASGAAEGDITIGTTTGGAEVVAATSYTVSQATGSYVPLTLVDGTLAAGDEVFASHDQAASADGTYFLQLKIRLGG
jgi:hypothetical protein